MQAKEGRHMVELNYSYYIVFDKSLKIIFSNTKYYKILLDCTRFVHFVV